MAEQKQIDPADDRYRYIGFEVFGSKDDPFWRNEDERKSYIAGLKEQIGSVYRNSVVYSNVVSKVDRIFIIIASAMMIIAPFLTWMKATTLYGPASFNGLLGVLNMGGFWFYVQKDGRLGDSAYRLSHGCHGCDLAGSRSISPADVVPQGAIRRCLCPEAQERTAPECHSLRYFSLNRLIEFDWSTYSFRAVSRYQ